MPKIGGVMSEAELIDKAHVLSGSIHHYLKQIAEDLERCVAREEVYVRLERHIGLAQAKAENLYKLCDYYQYNKGATNA
jgi:cation transport regulator ChaC